MKKISTLLMMLCMFAGAAWAQLYTPGARTTTLEAGKQYFIGAATFFSNARYNLLYNNGGDLTYSETKPNAIIDNAAYLFTVEEVGDNNTYYVKNSDGKYLLFNNKTSTETKTSITVVSYASVKGTITCGNDVQACDENGNKIEYDAITNETPVVCVYDGTSTNGWRHISGLEFARPTPFAFYEVEEVSLLPEVTTDVNAPKLYTIKNLRANKYATYNGATQSMSLKSIVDNYDGLFYFTAGADGTYKIHNLASSNKCASHNQWTADGIDWYIQKSGNSSYNGVAISQSATLTDQVAWNDFQGTGTSVNFWDGNDPGSVWMITAFKEGASAFALKMSTESEKHLYFIKNKRSNKYANFVAKGTQFTQVDDAGYGSYWYFVEKTDAENVPDGYKACYIYNAACDLGVENPSSGYMAALDANPYPTKLYYVRTFEKDNKWGYVMYDSQDSNGKGWNDQNSSTVTNYSYDDAGSVWSLIPANKTAAQLISEATTAKNNAMKLISAAEEADFYSYPAEALATAKTAVEAVNVNTLDGAVSSLLNAIVSTAMDALPEKGTTAPVAGQYIQLKNKQYKTYLKDNGSGLSGVDDATDFATLWYVVEGTDGNVKLQNALTEKYIGEIRQSANVAMVDDVEAAKQFAFTNQTDVYGVFKETTGGNYAYGHIAGHNVLVGWEKEADASQWIISEVSVDDALAELQAIYDVVENAFGDQPGQYKKTMQEIDAEMGLAEHQGMYLTFDYYAKEMLAPEAVVDAYMAKKTAATLKAQWDAVKTTVREINTPAQGKFYRLKNVASGNYMNGLGDEVELLADGASVHTTIFYLGDNNTLVSYNSGRYLDCQAKGYSAVGEAMSGEFAMAYNGAQANVFTYKNNDYSTYGAGADGGNLDRGKDTPNNAGYNWKLEEVTWLPIPVNVEAGWATLYSPVELHLSFGRFKAYTVSAVSEKWATLEPQTVVPAGVGVVLELQDGAQVDNGCVYLQIKANETTNVTSELRGTYADKYIPTAAYALGYLNVAEEGEPEQKEIGFYTAIMNQQEGASWLNNGFKAYLPKTVKAETLRFNFGGNTTAIESVLNNGVDANAPIYDLSGRRVNNAVKGGIYIKNGKKFIVK